MDTSHRIEMAAKALEHEYDSGRSLPGFLLSSQLSASRLVVPASSSPSMLNSPVLADDQSGYATFGGDSVRLGAPSEINYSFEEDESSLSMRMRAVAIGSQPDILDDIMLVDDQDEQEEIVEDIPEQQLLAMMELQEPSIDVCRRIFLPNWTTAAHANKVLPFDRVRELFEDGRTVVDGFAPLDLSESNAAARAMLHAGSLRPARDFLSLEEDPFRDRNARGDSIAFLLPHDDAKVLKSYPTPIQSVLDRLLALREDLKSRVIHLRDELPASSCEYQLAFYPGDGVAAYETHRDAFPVDDLSDDVQRRVTAVVYLNETTGGGQLRVHLKNGEHVDIDPVPGRLVLFLSGVVDHEFLPCSSDRFALTAWWR
ncbi:hypothetical protein BJ742DRAFT_180350 [Cladochytrium replicatum]|nr:hypothetical protein BJ742DRAFT_180350 [Cladochytrium replicatum]